MVVKVNKELALLYESKSLNCEMSVRWVLGYINDKYSQLISSQAIKKVTPDYKEQEVDDDLINRIYRKFNSSINIDDLFNFLCTIAFLLGGEE